MDIVIIGAGRLGSRLSYNLSEEGHDVTVIDNDKNSIETLVEKFDVIGVCGSGIDKDILLEAKVDKSDVVIATTDSDATNILSCLISKDLGAEHTVARVRDNDYFRQREFFKDKMEISRLINPDYETSREIARIIRYPAAMNIEEFNGKIDLVEIKIKENSPIADKEVRDAANYLNNKILICAIQRGDETIIPNGSTVINKGDLIYITGKDKDMGKLIQDMNARTKNSKKISNVMIIGGSRCSYYTAKKLNKEKYNVSIIEKNKDTANLLSDLLDGVDVANVDANEYDSLNEIGIRNMDVVITLSNSDELNMLTSAYADSVGVEKTITKIKNKKLSKLINFDNDNSIIDVVDVATNVILHYVRGKVHAHSEEMKSLYKLFDDDSIEAVEFEVGENTKKVGKKISELHLRKNVLLASINREGKFVVPNGNETIEVGDRIILIAKDVKLKKTNDIFS